MNVVAAWRRHSAGPVVLPGQLVGPAQIAQGVGFVERSPAAWRSSSARSSTPMASAV